MNAKSKEIALMFTDSKDGTTTVEKIEMDVDRTRRPVSPEMRKQIKAMFGKRTSPKTKRKKQSRDS